MKYKRWQIIILITIVINLLVGCESKIDRQDITTQKTEKPSLEVWIFFDQNTPGTHYLDMWDSLAKELDYQVNVKTFATEELKDKLRISLACDELPDIFSVWGGTFPDFLFDADACKPVQEYIKDSGISYKDSYVMPYRDGNNYIIPCLVEAYAITYCNNQLMNEIGVTPPKTWNDLIDVVEKINQYNLQNGTNYAAIELGDKDNWLGELLYNIIVNRMDPYALDKLIRGEISFDDPIFLSAANRCVELVEADAFPDDYLETGEVESIENFINNESVMFPHQSTITYYLMDNMGADAFTSVQFPNCGEAADTDYASYLIDINHTLTPGLCISQKTAYPDEAANICLKFAEAVNEINVTEYGYLNLTEDELMVPENLPEPVVAFTSMIEDAKTVTSLLYAQLPKDNANEWRSLTKRLFAQVITPEEFIAEGGSVLHFPYEYLSK